MAVTAVISTLHRLPRMSWTGERMTAPPRGRNRRKWNSVENYQLLTWTMTLINGTLFQPSHKLNHKIKTQVNCIFKALQYIGQDTVDLHSFLSSQQIIQ